MDLDYCYPMATGIKRIYIKAVDVPIDTLALFYRGVDIRYACEIGCKNFAKKWCCPPESKTLNILMGGYSRVLITCIYVLLDDFKYINGGYQKIRAANSILKSLSNKLSRTIERDVYGLALLNGSCNLCRPCAKKLDLPCKKPDDMRFSMESTGIDVCKLLQETLGFHLQWYGKACTPDYTAVVSCILFEDSRSYDMQPIHSIIKNAIQPV